MARWSIAAWFRCCRREGSSIVTIEGLGADAQARALQDAFLEYGGAQCGICTPGMILAAVQLLNEILRRPMDDIREGLAGNLCRCTGYPQIFEAVAEAARRAARQYEVRSSRLRTRGAG